MILAGMSAFIASDKLLTAARHNHKPTFHMNLEAADLAIAKTIAAMATTIALIYCHKAGKDFTPPEPDRSLIENLLLMMGIFNPKMQECLDKLWILYGDHGMTNSLAAVLHAGSTLTDPASIAIAGLVSGYGPLHGGAIDLAYKALQQIGTPENVPRYIAGCKANGTRLFGYGHRVYKAKDPRLPLVQELIDSYFYDVQANPVLRIVVEIDKFAKKDPYFEKRGLKANADLFGCFLYMAM